MQRLKSLGICTRVSLLLVYDKHVQIIHIHGAYSFQIHATRWYVRLHLSYYQK